MTPCILANSSLVFLCRIPGHIQPVPYIVPLLPIWWFLCVLCFSLAKSRLVLEQSSVFPWNHSNPSHWNCLQTFTGNGNRSRNHRQLQRAVVSCCSFPYMQSSHKRIARNTADCSSLTKKPTIKDYGIILLVEPWKVIRTKVVQLETKRLLSAYGKSVLFSCWIWIACFLPTQGTQPLVLIL